MRPVSDAFAAAAVRPHTLAVRVEVLRDGAIISTLTTVAGGEVTLDGSAGIRGRCDLTLVDDGTLGLVPQIPSDPLAPYGNEVRAYRGLYLPGAQDPELVSLGIFGIEDTDVDETPDGLTITLTGLDRAKRVSDARFEEPYQIAAGTNVGTAIAALISHVFPGIPTNFAATSHTTPQIVAEEGGDRWDLATDLARNAGLRLHFDGDGTPTLAPDAGGGAPVARLVEGRDVTVTPLPAEEEGAALTGAGRRWNREGAFNAVIATGENTGLAAPVRGVARDENPLSPTYYYGPFGKVPRFYTSPLLLTNSQCGDAAEAILARELGTTQRVRFDSFVLAHLEPGDVARLTRNRIGLNEDHILDTLTIPLAASAGMAGTTRAVQVT